MSLKMNVVLLHYNYTGKLGNQQMTPINNVDFQRIVSLIVSLIVLENLTVLVAIWRNHRFHNRMYFFIGNLALCDLLAGHSNSEHAMSLLRTVIIVVGVFIACWTPLFILLLVDVASEQHFPVLYQADWFIALAVLNSAMNPVIYTLVSREMRRAFLALVCGHHGGSFCHGTTSDLPAPLARGKPKIAQGEGSSCQQKLPSEGWTLESGTAPGPVAGTGTEWLPQKALVHERKGRVTTEKCSS
uniref:Sphingosine-1-phosphate receptor 3 n=1 Tax=Xiphophorus maculatus TaxID=8083 RepID=M4ARN0_XIPMA